ncbi:hypothetical protein FPV67DRAFT_163368 [Lyophyllum atratum]|nr:hypothetical protein FPV67DRAFT_163368 [Lyophyllum atratum]
MDVFLVPHSPGFSDTSSSYHGSDTDVWFSDNSSNTSAFATPPPSAFIDHEILPSPPSPFRNISFEDRQHEIKSQVFESSSGSNSQSSTTSNSQSKDGLEDSGGSMDISDPSSQDTQTSSPWSILSQDAALPDSIEVDEPVVVVRAPNPSRAVLSPRRVPRMFTAEPNNMDIDMNSGDNLAIFMLRSNTDVGPDRPVQRRRSPRNTRGQRKLRSPGDRPTSGEVSNQSPGPSNTGRHALTNANAGRNIGRLSRRESEDGNTGDWSMMNLPGDLPVLESVASTSDSAEGERFHDLVYCDDTGRWRCRGPACEGMAFSTKSSAKRHVEETLAHASDSSRRFRCDKCGRRFPRLESVNRHDEVKHRMK